MWDWMHEVWFGLFSDSSSTGAERLGSYDGHGNSTLAGHVEWLFLWITWISVASFVLLMVLMVYFAWRYRRKPGVPIQRSASHNTPLELFWSIGPLVIMTWMFFEGFWGYARANIAEAGPEVVDLVAQKWSWTLTYPNGANSPESVKLGRDLPPGATEGLTGTMDIPVFVVPMNRPVQLRMTSVDVLHSFFVPDFRYKFDVFPNRYTSYWFRATRPGDHYVFCAEYCGDQHSEMAALIRVVPEDQYVSTVTRWATPTGTPEQIGAFLYKTKGCRTCHSTDGSAGTGPTWKNLYGYPVELASGAAIPSADENFIRESILTPGASIVKGFSNQMPITPLTDEQVNALVAYIRSLSDKAPASLLDQPAPDAGAAPAGGGG